MSVNIRDILYRAKHKTGEWVYGIPLFDLADCSFKEKGKCTWHNGELLTFYAWIDELHEYDEVEVQVDTIGKWTGVIDKNKVRIFEGDIISGNGSRCKRDYFTIQWSDGCCGYTAGKGKCVFPNMNQATMDSYEVVGNIYDNKELLCYVNLGE